MAKILVVEDDLISQALLKRLLGAKGHTLHTSGTAGEAMSVLGEIVDFDLVVLDNQLKGEFGWQLLRQIRANPVFKELPVIVYTATSDRTSVIKYLQLGVQKILVKPYNAQTLEEQIQAANQKDWRDSVLQPVDIVCKNLQLSREDYLESLGGGAKILGKTIPRLNQLVGTKNLQLLSEPLAKIHGIGTNLGIDLLREAVASYQEAAREDRVDECVELINQLVPLARIMQGRSGVNGTANGTAYEEDEAEEPGTRPPMPSIRPSKETSSPNDEPSAARSLMSRPLADFAEDLGILLARPLLTHDEVIEQATHGAGKRHSEPFADSLRFLCDSELQTSDNLCQRAKSIEGVDRRLGYLAVKSTGVQPRSLEHALNLVGFANSATILVVLQWLHLAEKASNPLRLRAMAEHSLAVGMLTREMGLRFKKLQAFAGVGAMHNVGAWILALQFPALYGLAVHFGRNDTDKLADAEKALFTMNNTDVAKRCLTSWRLPEEAINVVATYLNPVGAKAGPSRILAALVNLASLLAKAKRLGFSGSSGKDVQDRFVNSPAWEALRLEDAEIPMKPVEYLNLLDPIAERARKHLALLFS